MKKILSLVHQSFIGIILMSFLLISCKESKTEEEYLSAIQQKLNNELLQSLDKYEQIFIEVNTNILNLDSTKIRQLDSEFDLEKYKEKLRLEIKNTVKGLNLSRVQLYDINNCLDETPVGKSCELLISPILKPLSSSILDKRVAINNEITDIITNKQWFKDFYIPERCQDFHTGRFRLMNPFGSDDNIYISRLDKNKQIEQSGENVEEFILDWTGACSYNLKPVNAYETKREVRVEIIKTSPEGYTYIVSEFEDGQFVSKYFGRVLIENE